MRERTRGGPYKPPSIGHGTGRGQNFCSFLGLAQIMPRHIIKVASRVRYYEPMICDNYEPIKLKESVGPCLP